MEVFLKSLLARMKALEEGGVNEVGVAAGVRCGAMGGIGDKPIVPLRPIEIVSP